MSSSMRNAAPRRAFKERSQPKDRERFGILEKHKDYALRSKDFNEKTKKLKALKRKAQDRNPDEFSFSMMSSKTKNGIKVADRGNVAMSLDATRLLKTQDAGYIRTTLQQTRRQIQGLEQGSGAVLISGEVASDNTEVRALGSTNSKRSSHVLYVANDDDKKDFDLNTWREKMNGDTGGEDTMDVMDGNSENSDGETDDSHSELDTSSTKKATTTTSKKIPRYELVRQKERDTAARKQKRSQDRAQTRSRASLLNKVKALRAREKTLSEAEAGLDLQRARMNNQPVGGVTKKGQTFRIRERRR